MAGAELCTSKGCVPCGSCRAVFGGQRGEMKCILHKRGLHYCVGVSSNVTAGLLAAAIQSAVYNSSLGVVGV